MANVLDDITDDLDWRETEIAAMRIVLMSPNTSPTQKMALLRASWALLYAHYEGFCRNALSTYYDAVSNSGIHIKDLPKSSKLFAMDSIIKGLRTLPDNEFLDEVLDFEDKYLSMPPEFPDVDTQSNLWPNVLVELLRVADLNPDVVIKHSHKLKTLVSRRNKIAHGENNIISEVSYYQEFEKAVYDVMYDLAFQIDEKLSSEPLLN